MQQNRNLRIHTFLHVRFGLNHVGGGGGGSLHDRRFMRQAGRTRYSAWLAHKAPVMQAMWGAIVVGTGLTGSNFTLTLLRGGVCFAALALRLLENTSYSTLEVSDGAKIHNYRASLPSLANNTFFSPCGLFRPCFTIAFSKRSLRLCERYDRDTPGERCICLLSK